MRIVPEIEQKIRREIRDARAKDPLVSVLSLQEQLEKKFDRTFTRKYLAKLAHKVERQALVEADRTQIEQRMQFTRENYRMMRERLLKIVYWTKETAQDGMKAPLPMDITDAAKTVVMLDLALLKAEIETGMYKKPMEALIDAIRYEPLPTEVREVVIRSWRNFGMLPAATVEKMVPEKHVSGG
jgi:hypothetical protein